MKLPVFLFLAIAFAAGTPLVLAGKSDKIYEVVKVKDFEITGGGGGEAWTKAAWGEMKRQGRRVSPGRFETCKAAHGQPLPGVGQSRPTGRRG